MQTIVFCLPRIHRHFRHLLGIIAAIFWLGVVQAVPLAHAVGGGATFALKPVFYDTSNPSTRDFFIFQGKPGEQKQNSVRVKNVGKVASTANLYPVDAITDQQSGVAFPAKTAPRHDVGAWITLSRTLVTLQPDQSVDVPFVLNIPRNVRPGQHGGGIAVEPVQSDNDTLHSKNLPGLSIEVIQRTGVGVLVDLPGPLVSNLTTRGVSYGGSDPYQHVLVELTNAGTIMIHPYGTLQIRDSKGTLLQDLPLKLDVIIPLDSIQYPVYMRNKALAIGTYKVTLSLKYEQNRTLNYSGEFTIKPKSAEPASFLPTLVKGDLSSGDFFSQLTPWHYTGAVFLLLLIIGGLIFWGQRLYLVAANSKTRAKQVKDEAEKFRNNPKP